MLYSCYEKYCRDRIKPITPANHTNGALNWAAATAKKKKLSKMHFAISMT